MTALNAVATTLADVLEAIAGADLTSTSKAQLRSAVNRVCTWLERPPATLPACRRSLGPALKSFQRRCAGHGVTTKSVSNVLGLLNRALDLVDRRPQSLPPVSALRSEAWSLLYRTWRAGVPKAYGPLATLMRFCDLHGIPPDAVDDAVAEQVLAYMTNTRLRDRDTAVHHLRGYWNSAADRVLGWPQRRLTIGLKERTPATLPLSAFPESFREDIDRFRREAAYLPVEGDGPARRRYDLSAVVAASVVEHARGLRRRLRPLAPATLDACERAIITTATALIKKGVPLESIRSINDVVTAQGLAVLVDSVLDRLENRGKINRHVRNLVGSLYMVAMRERPDFAEDRSFHELGERIRADFPVEDGMTVDNARDIAQFDNPAAVRALFELPGKVLAEVEANRESRRRRGLTPVVTRSMALKVMHGIAVMVLLSLPVRVGTLVRTEWGHVRLPKGRNGSGFIDWPAALTKTRVAASVELSAEKMRALLLWRDVYRPAMGTEPNNPFVFPATGVEHRHRSTLGNYLSSLVLRYTGCSLTSHQFRHLIRTLVLDADPGAEALANALLGHAPNSRSAHRYGAIRPAVASRTLAHIIERQAAATHRVRKSGRRS